MIPTPEQSALRLVYELLKQGVEYPDAEYKAVKKYGVDVDELRKNYDAGVDWRKV